MALLLIAAAALVGVASLMFPWLLSHPDRVRDFLSAQLQRPVQFERMSGEWRAGGPIFSLEGLRVGGERGAPELLIERAELKVDFYAFLQRGRSWHELDIVAPVIDVQRQIDGRWQVRQWRGASSGASGFDLSALQSLGAVGLRGARVNLSDAASGRALDLVDVELRISQSLLERQVSVRFRPAAGTVPMQVACELDSTFANGTCYLRGRDLVATEWSGSWPIAGVAAAGGALDIDAWIDLAAFRPQRARLELSARQVIWRGERVVQLSNGQTVEPRYSPDRMSLSLQWQSTIDDGWSLGLIEADAFEVENSQAAAQRAPTRLSVRRGNEAGHPVTRIEVQSLRLERVLPWLALSDALSPTIAGMLYESAPSGELSKFALVASDGARTLQGEIREIGLHATRKLPNVQGLSGRVHGDALATMIELDAVKTDFSYPGVFRKPLPIAIAPMVIALLPIDNGVRVAVEQLRLEGQGYGIAGQFALDFVEGGGKPWLDAVIDVLPGEVSSVNAVWPVNAMPAQTVRWLDQALLAGHIDGGSVVFRGDLDDWPFAADQGRFEAVANISDSRVHFNPAWPDAQLQRARVQFLDNTMQIDIAAASIAGNPISSASARIADMHVPVLHLQARSPSRGDTLLGLIRSSPLQQRFGAELLGVSIDGDTDVDIDLKIPLGRSAEEHKLEVAGVVSLKDAGLRDLKWNLRFDKANGRVRFSQGGFSADALDVRVADDVAELNIAAGEFVGDQRHQLEASLRGELPVSSLVPGLTMVEPYFALLPGKALWDLSLLVERTEPGQVAAKRLHLTSDLQGIAIDLPAPLRKDASTMMPLQLDLDLPIAGSRVNVQLGQLARFSAIAADPTRPFVGHLALGGGLADNLPEAGLRVTGAAPAIDLSGWAGLSHNEDDDNPMPLDVALRAEEVDVLGRAFSNTAVTIKRSLDDLDIRLAGEGIDGNFELASDHSDVPGITARFKTLHWPEARPSSISRPLDPLKIPPLHIWVGDLKLGASAFGEARIETRPTETGMRIEELNTRSPTLTMRASGTWALGPDGETSALDFTFSAEDIGLMLKGLGYGSVIEGGQTVASLRGHWQGSPAQFALSRVTGVLEGEVGEGRILDVEPGAGRLFGLVNFSAIPRRLSLDFSDFFKSGFAFDSIKGKFQLDQGNAITENLRVSAPSAQILVRGRAGLIARDYDQEMEVIPRIRSALPLVGAVAGGPVGAVFGVLAQDVLRKPLDEIVTARYRVQGSWDKPDVVLIAKEKRRVAREEDATSPAE